MRGAQLRDKHSGGLEMLFKHSPLNPLLEQSQIVQQRTAHGAPDHQVLSKCRTEWCHQPIYLDASRESGFAGIADDFLRAMQPIRAQYYVVRCST